MITIGPINLSFVSQSNFLTLNYANIDIMFWMSNKWRDTNQYEELKSSSNRVIDYSRFAIISSGV